MQGDTTFSFSPEPKLHGQRRSESALFDIRGLVELQNAHAQARPRVPTSTGFVDVKSLLKADDASNVLRIASPSSRLVMIPRTRTEVIRIPDRNAPTRRLLWAVCITMFAMLVVMAFAVLR